MYIPSTSNSATLSDVSTVTVASAQFASMIEGNKYRLVSTTNAWVKLGSNPTAVAATDGNLYLPANSVLEIFAVPGNLKVAIIRDTADGNASLTLAGT